MVKLLESAGERLLGLVAPNVVAVAGCAPDPWCSKCSNGKKKSCRIHPRCYSQCGSCGTC